MACFTATSNSAAPHFQYIHEKLCRCTSSIKFRDNHPEFRCFVPISLTVTHCDPL
ncbi:hypothetical protein B0H12DRAFT_1118296 [Mycena haematopus]|nr:hypothetical protein B0H12DRAFT_1118296 [Mycena haematopus]